jgi:hypothetical protein
MPKNELFPNPGLLKVNDNLLMSKLYFLFNTDESLGKVPRIGVSCGDVTILTPIATCKTSMIFFK